MSQLLPLTTIKVNKGSNSKNVIKMSNLNKAANLIKTYYKEYKICPICMESGANYVLNCGHTFHKSCLQKLQFPNNANKNFELTHGYFTKDGPQDILVNRDFPSLEKSLKYQFMKELINFSELEFTLPKYF